MAPNTKIVLLLLGLLAGGVYGYVTRPQSAEIKIGGTSIEFSSNRISTSSSSSGLTSAQGQHIALYAVGGGIIGLLLGLVAERRR